MKQPVLIVLLLIRLCFCDLDPKKTLVWGPGLRPFHVVLPVRYFFIHAVDQNGDKYNTSTGIQFDVTLSGSTHSSRPCLIGKEILNRKDGSVIVRYRLRESCKTLSIEITHNQQHVRHSPYITNDPVYSEDCPCPIKNMETWLTLMRCPYEYKQIDRDLKPFPKVDFKRVFKQMRKTFNRPESTSYCHYAVKDNKVYRSCYGKYVGFNMFMDAILLSMSRKVLLPDMEFMVNLGDWPLISPAINPPLPLFSWCGSDETKDIVMPTYDLTESTLQAMNRVSLDILSVQGNIGRQWDDKVNMAFWRGRDSRRERIDLVQQSRMRPKLIDAAITHVFFFKDKMEEIQPLKERVSFFSFFDYKYQINVDGTVAAFRLPYLLSGDSVILKQDSPYYEHFYSDLKPWEHYIPIKRDLSDLVYKLKWAKNHDKEAKRIARSSRQYVEEHLLPIDVFCYHGVLFQEWAKRLQDKVVVEEDMEEVVQSPDKYGCKCQEDSNPRTVPKNKMNITADIRDEL